MKWRDAGVVGFDIAGAEAGHPPSRHLDAFQYVMRETFTRQFTPVKPLGCRAFGKHFNTAVLLALAMAFGSSMTLRKRRGWELGRLAEFVRDRRIPLELCPTSNVNTGVCADIASHPIGLLRDLRFRVTVNTDNRLMSNTSMSHEFVQLSEAFETDLADMQWLTINAMKSAFTDFPERLHIINNIIKPGYESRR